MFLDAYYKMQAYSRMCMAKYNGNGTTMQVPAITLCSGNSISVYYVGGTNISGNNAWAGTRNTFTTPIQGMVSQTATVSSSGSRVVQSNIILGKGMTPVTPSDYRMEEELVSEFVCESVTATVDFDSGKLIHKKTMTNTSDGDITVSEIGLSWLWPSAFSEASLPQVLVYREVLAEPITVAPGETFTVTITHAFPMPE